MHESHSRLPPLRIPMSYLVPATLVAAFTSLGRATSRAIRKGAVLLFSIVVLLDGGAATTPAPTPTATLTPTPSTTPAQGFGIGCVYMIPALHVGDPDHDLKNKPCWTNSHFPVVLLRETWGRLEQTKGNRDWSFFDKGVELAREHGKKFAVVVAAGYTSPSWIFDSPTNAYAFPVQTRHGKLNMPLPWDSKFQAAWSDTVHALGSRYGNDPLCVYANISGVGRVHESTFVRAQEDIDACNAKASSDGFSSCMDAWTAGAKWITDMFHDAFPNKPFLFIGAIPSPKQDGLDALNNVIDWAAAKYPNFGFANEGLWPGNNYPRADSPGTLQIKKLSAAGHPTMYQFHKPVRTVAEMKTSLDKGIANGARGIEIFPGNCNQSEMWPLFDDANTRMLAGGDKLKAKVKAK